MQADMSSTITQVETLQSYLEQGIEAVMVKDDAILRKQATEKGMVILSQKTLEICQQRQKVKGADVIIFARLKSDTYIRYALEENCFLERLDCNIYGSSRWLNKYLEGTLEITTQLVAANKLRIDIRNLADIPLILKPIPQTSICLNELEPIELQGSARKVIFASLSDMTLSSYDLNVEVVNLFSTETNMPYVYNIPVKGMLFSKSESGVLNCAIIPQPKTIRSNTHSKFVINEQTCIQVATNKAKTEIHFLTDRLKQAASLTPEIKQFLVPKNNIIVFKELPKNCRNFGVAHGGEVNAEMVGLADDLVLINEGAVIREVGTGGGAGHMDEDAVKEHGAGRFVGKGLELGDILGADLRVDGQVALERIRRVGREIAELALHLLQEAVGNGQLVIAEAAVIGQHREVAGCLVAREIRGRDLDAVFVVLRRHGIGVGVEAHPGAVLLQIGGHEPVVDEDAAVGHFLVSGEAHHGGAAAADVGRQGLDGKARGLRVKTHGQALGMRVAVPEAGHGGVGYLDDELEGAVGEIGFPERHHFLAVVDVLIVMLAEETLDLVILADAELQFPDAGFVFHAYGQLRHRRYAVGLWRDGHSGTVHILEKSVGSAGKDDDDEGDEQVRQEASTHGSSL